MDSKSTDKLEEILHHTHEIEFEHYLAEQRQNMINEANSFGVYMKTKFEEHGYSQREVFIYADIPERYGYKLLSGEKKTTRRDTILRICYAGGLTLEETQTALKKYGMPVLYAKVPRDALLMILFRDRNGSVIDVNISLKAHSFDPLRSSGTRE